VLELNNYKTNSWMGMVKTSEQMIMDCNPMRDGCAGGFPAAIFQDWMIPDGIYSILDSDYPYTASRSTCLYPSLPKTNIRPTSMT